MKTSDKILLYSALFALTAFVGTNLLHYAKYRAGNILDANAINAQDYTQHALPGIHSIILDGPMRATLYPSDHFEFDLPRDAGGTFDYRQQGDSLLLFCTDRKRIRDPHDNWNSYLDYPPVHIYFPRQTRIHTRNVFATLSNEVDRKDVSAFFLLDSSQLWVGAFRPEADTIYVIEHFDSLRVSAINSTIIFNKQSHIAYLDLRLDDRSDAEDRFSTIDSAVYLVDSNTNLRIRGKNSNKIRFATMNH
jgi:hypothetical protein